MQLQNLLCFKNLLYGGGKNMNLATPLAMTITIIYWFIHASGWVPIGPFRFFNSTGCISFGLRKETKAFQGNSLRHRENLPKWACLVIEPRFVKRLLALYSQIRLYSQSLRDIFVGIFSAGVR